MSKTELRERATRVIPRKMAPLAALTVLLLFAMSSALAINSPTSPMELEGNIADDAASAPTDWGAIFDANGDEIGAALPAGTLDTTEVIQDFVPGATGPDISYHEPSNKDDQPIDPDGDAVWGCVSVANPTDKTDIVNAYGMAITGDDGDSDGDSAGDQLFYFGVERFDNSGDAFIGLWLFQDDVSCTSDGKFVGSKQTGDVLILANFTGGGSDALIQLFRYTADPAGGDGTFDDLAEVTDKCEVTLTVTDICATLNDSTSITTPWAMEDKQKPGPPSPDVVKTLEPDQFVEGGVNLTDVFDAADLEAPPCFGSFLAETRSSSSLDATLKDYALGDLLFCNADISITPSETNRVGDAHTFTVEVDKKVGSGEQAADSGDVEYTLTGDLGIEQTDIEILAGTTCQNDGDPDTFQDDLDADGKCIIVFRSLVSGTVTGHASVQVDVGGSLLFRETDGDAPNSGDAVKTYVDASLDIAPDGTNRIGNSHTFTVTAKADNGDDNGYVAANGVTVTVAFTNADGADAQSDQTCVTAGSGTCTVSITSANTGSNVATASATINAGPTGSQIAIPVTTTADSSTAALADATKTWVDATIDITGDGTNRVGASHTFTVSVETDNGGAGQPVAAAGVTVTVHKVDANGAVSNPAGDQTCVTAGAGTCTVAFTSNDTGTVTGTADASVTLAGLTFGINTTDDALVVGNEAVLKTFVDATIDITGDGTNRIGANHTFTVSVKTDNGGAGQPVAASGVTVTVHKVDANGAVSNPAGDQTCVTGAGGTCTVAFSSNDTGTTTGTADASVTLAGLTFSINTTDDALVVGNEAVVKTWVDATIDITGDDTNGIGEAHTFTVSVKTDNGGAGQPVAANGVTVTVHKVDAGGAVSNPAGDQTCVTGAGGTCTVAFTSNSAGTTTGTADASVTVAGLTFSINTTDDALVVGNEAVLKIWVDGTLVWHKVDGNGDPLGGATFEVCRTHTLDTSTFPESLFDDDPDICVSVLDNDTNPGAGEAADEDPADGEFLMTGLILGTYTVRETAAPAGYHIGNANAVLAGSHSLDADPDVLDLEIEDPFVNLRAFRLIVIGCDDITDLLEETTVWVDLNDDTVVDPGETLLSITDVPAHLGDKGVTEADLCGTDAVEAPTDIPANGLGGASYGGLAPFNYRSTMLIPN